MKIVGREETNIFEEKVIYRRDVQVTVWVPET